ncbi:hypothetical protein ARTHRO9AX_150233 [Arthrobacter sp. 9AX]|nr:hypothetical protein ARTHRO9AX_150233 [Arthrobacter sp. 9AX]
MNGALEAELDAAVSAARSNGDSWEAIGAALARLLELPEDASEATETTAKFVVEGDGNVRAPCLPVAVGARPEHPDVHLQL